MTDPGDRNVITVPASPRSPPVRQRFAWWPEIRVRYRLRLPAGGHERLPKADVHRSMTHRVAGIVALGHDTEPLTAIGHRRHL